MVLVRLRQSVAIAGVAGLMLVGVPTANAAADHVSKHVAVGDSCLVGTWRDNPGRTTTRFEGHTVVMHTGGGDIDHIAASGADLNTFTRSKIAIGSYLGHRVTERIRGTNRLTLRATTPGRRHVLTITEKGWSAHATNHFTYRGQRSNGYFTNSGRFSYRFRCTLTSLTFLTPKGHRLGSETRVSFRP